MRARIGFVVLAAAVACVLLFAAAQAPAAHRHGSSHTAYRGKTSQRYGIQISVTPGRITLIRFKAKLLCRDGSYLFGDASDFEATRLKRGGRFADTQYGKTDVVSWRGRLSSRKVKGTLRVKDRLKSGVRCDSQPVRFTARRVGR